MPALHRAPSRRAAGRRAGITGLGSPFQRDMFSSKAIRTTLRGWIFESAPPVIITSARPRAMIRAASAIARFDEASVSVIVLLGSWQSIKIEMWHFFVHARPPVSLDLSINLVVGRHCVLKNKLGLPVNPGPENGELRASEDQFASLNRRRDRVSNFRRAKQGRVVARPKSCEPGFQARRRNFGLIMSKTSIRCNTITDERQNLLSKRSHRGHNSDPSGRRARSRAPTEPLRRSRTGHADPRRSKNRSCSSASLSRKLYLLSVNRPFTISWPSMTPAPLNMQSWASNDVISTRSSSFPARFLRSFLYLIVLACFKMDDAVRKVFHLADQPRTGLREPLPASTPPASPGSRESDRSGILPPATDS